MKILFIFLTTLFLLSSAENESHISLWDQIIKMEQIVLSVEYHGRRLNVWKEDNHGRYYVTPLCVMDPKTIVCDKDEFSANDHYIFTFNIQLWDTLAANTIQLALKQQKGIDIKTADIHPLPMQNVRLSINRDDMNSVLKIDNRWHSYQSQPNNILMNFGVKNEEFCKNMTKQAKSDLAGFLSKIKLEFEFTMSTVQEEFRVLNITGKTIAKNEFFTELKNEYADKDGKVHLNSNDLNKLAHDIFRTVKITEAVTARYIKSDEENEIIGHLLNEIKGQEVHASDLYKAEWESVFWDDIFSRPDIQTEYFNETLIFDSKKDHFIFDETKDNEFRKRIEDRYSNKNIVKGSGGGGFSFAGFKIGGSGSKGSDNTNEGENVVDEGTKDKYIVKKDDLQEVTNKKDVNVKWTGTKFTMKDLKLQRINTKALQSLGEIYYKRIVISNSDITQKIPILPDPTTSIGYDKPPLYYDMLQQKFEAFAATLKAEISQINEKLVNLENGHGNTKTRLSTLIECSHTAGTCTQLPITQ